MNVKNLYDDESDEYTCVPHCEPETFQGSLIAHPFHSALDLHRPPNLFQREIDQNPSQALVTT